LSGRGLFNQLLTLVQRSPTDYGASAGMRRPWPAMGRSGSGKKLPIDAKIHEFPLNFNKDLP